MRIHIQLSDLQHVALMKQTLQAHGDMVQSVASLAQLVTLARESPADGYILEFSPEAATWFAKQSATQPGAKAVFLTPRSSMGEVMAVYPDLSLLPTPGTALAARFLLSDNPANDPSCRLGDYQLTDLTALGRRTHIFRALQCSIARPVVLRLLNLELENDQEAVDEFLEDARAKAAITHDRVGTVFQALESHGAIFYTAETLDGQTLEEIKRANGHLTPRQFIETLRTLASAFSHMEARGVATTPIELRHIHMPAAQGSTHGVPRFANQATHGPIDPLHHPRQFQHTLQLVRPLLASTTPQAIHTAGWADALLQQPLEKLDFTAILNDARSQLADLDRPPSSTRPATTHAATSAQSAKSPRTAVIAVAGIAIVALVGILVKSGSSRPKVQRVVEDVDTTIPYTGGTFQHPTRGEIEIASFNLDKYEVTIRQYAQFLDNIVNTDPKAFADPQQAAAHPARKDFKPKDWDIWYPIALAGGMYEGHLLTLDCPVFHIDWWCAQAYARWKNRRLPSEDEWEIAARGKTFLKYPWGNNWDRTRCNAADKPTPLDGHDAWCPVDLPMEDSTPEGARGFAGNVSEWTDSTAVHPEFPDRTIPVVKGGSFGTREIDGASRVRVLSRNEEKPWLGFRTAADHHTP